MDLFIPVFFIFVFFVICSMCGVCCRKSDQGAIYSTPVVVTSQTHQPIGAPMSYQITPQVYSQQQFTTTTVQQMPYNPSVPAQIHASAVVTPHYPPQHYQQAPAMYPPEASMNPPPYNEALNTELYPKQQAFNPNYNSKR